MRYVDGYLLAVPKRKLRAYRTMARQGARAWKKYGALDYAEAVGDDLAPPSAGIRFPKTVKARPGEVVIFSFIVFKSRAHRDQVNRKVMAEMERKYKDDPNSMKNMPFDPKRMVYGGFRVIA